MTWSWRHRLALRITLLGPPRIEVAGRPIVVDTRKAVALLAYVAVVGRPVARESLAELLWPESDPDGGRGALRRTLSVLRTGLGGGWLRIDRAQVELDGEDVDVDVAAFRRAIREAGHAHGPDDRCPACRRALSRAVGLHRGDFLEGFALRDSAAFDEWQTLEAEALRGELSAALRRLLELEAGEGRWADALAVGRRLLTLDALDEAAHRSLMRLHAAGGDRPAAIRQFRECVRVLDAELGVEPEAETRSLYEALVRTKAGPRTPPPRPPIAALDEGTRRLLEAAAILGDGIDPDLAREVSGEPEHAATAGIEALVTAGLLLEPERGGGPGQVYRFAGERVGPRVLEELGLARRRQLHRRAAVALEARFDRGAPDARLATRVAQHLAAAGRPREAAAFHRLAGEAMRRLSAHAEAAEHFRAALALGHEDRLALHEGIGDVETLRGRYGEALAAYELGAALAGPDDVARFEHRLGSLHLRRGALELADLHLAAALARLGAGASVLRARVLADRSLVALRRDESPAAHRLARASLREARASGDPDTEAQAENLLAMLARRSGDLVAARRHLRRSLDRAGVADRPDARVAALNNLALLERAAGDPEIALALTDEALRRCVILGDRHREAALRNNRADLLHALGRPREAAEELVRSVTAFAEVGEQRGLEPEIWKLVDW